MKVSDIPSGVSVLIKRVVGILALVALCLSLPFGLAEAKKAAPLALGVYTDLDALAGLRVGVQSGTTSDEDILRRLPDVEVRYFNNKADLVAALTGEKISAFVMDEPVAQVLMREYDALTYIPEYIGGYDYSFVFPNTDAGKKLRAQYNEFLAGLRADGTLDQLVEEWFSEDEDAKSMPDIDALPAPNGVLTVATESGYAPFEYVRGTKVVGYDMEIAARFCEAHGYGMKILDMSYDSIISAVQADKCDFAAAGIDYAPERAENVLFADANFSCGTVVVVLKAPEGAMAGGGIAGMNGKRIGIQMGTNYDSMVSGSLPDAEKTCYNTPTDLIEALSSGKIDAFPIDEPVLRYIMGETSGMSYIPEYLDTFDLAFGFPKTETGEKLCEEMSAFLRKIKADGTLAQIDARWFSHDENAKPMPDYKNLPAPNGTLIMGMDATYPPFEYMRGSELVGYELEIAALFCEAYGYGLSFSNMSLDALLPSLQSGKCDFLGSGLTITPERAESVRFSEPFYTGGVLLAVPAAPQASGTKGKGLFADIQASFEKTFIREARWKLFIEGVVNTLLITLLSILCGTALGFGVFMLCRNGNRVANGITRFSTWLVQGMPMVVLLMILYYVVFGNVAIDGKLVATIGFTLTFGAAVLGMLKMGVGAVDRGQYEAAWALGYSNTRTFFRIILPQALPHVMPAYRGEIISIIKATAVVGYIAVQDLTKMGDIIRSRTYEAFFPLIAVTIIYFVLEGILNFVVGKFEIWLNPKRRKNEEILQGVNT